MALYKRLVEFGQKHRILICNDNPYSFILNEEQLSILSVEGARTCCIELNSLSKAHNMAIWLGVEQQIPKSVNFSERDDKSYRMVYYR